MIAIKIHRSYRIVVGICDSDLVGKKFEEGKKQLDCRESFYKEEVVDEERAIQIIKRQAVEDATFNIVGEKSIKCSIKVGIINEESVGYITGIPFALTFL